MGQAFGTAVMFNETVVAQARVIAPTMKFHLYAHFAVREKIARDMEARGLVLDPVTDLPRKAERDS